MERDRLNSNSNPSSPGESSSNELDDGTHRRDNSRNSMNSSTSNNSSLALDYYFRSPTSPLTPTFKVEDKYFYPPPIPSTQEINRPSLLPALSNSPSFGSSSSSLRNSQSRLSGPRPLGLPRSPHPQISSPIPSPTFPPYTAPPIPTQKRRPAPLIPSISMRASSFGKEQSIGREGNLDSAAARFNADSAIPIVNLSSPETEPEPMSRNSSISSQSSIASVPYSNSTLTPTTSYRRPPTHRTESITSINWREGNLKNYPNEGNEDLTEYLNTSLLSNIAMFVKEVVPISHHFKGPIEYAGFKGKDIVDAIQECLPEGHSRSFSTAIAKTLQANSFFVEVDSDLRTLRDSDRNNAVYVFAADPFSQDDLEIPSGVLTSLTKCYSSSCDVNETSSLCYSYSCPNRRLPLLRQPSIASTGSYNSEHITENPENWESSVEKTVIESISKDEIARQSIIFELIQGEAAYLKDLTTIETGFVQPLRLANPPIIPTAQLESFLDSILLNIAEIRQHSNIFLSKLVARQLEQYPLIESIGDIILESAIEWSEAYTKYTRFFPQMELNFKKERDKNPKFALFLQEFSRSTDANRQGFEHFQTRSTFRAVRYSLLLEPILKKTPFENQDRELLDQALQVLKHQSKEADKAVAATKSRIALKNYARDLNLPKTGCDLDLLNPERTHFLSTRGHRIADAGFSDWTELHCILFDHYLVSTKLRSDRSYKYSVSRRPIPLELIKLSPKSFEDPPVPRSSGFHLRRRESEAVQASDTTLAYPIYFRHSGRDSGIIAFYVDSANVRKIWETKLKEAIRLRKELLDKSPAIQLLPITDSSTFPSYPIIGSLAPSSPPLGRPTCSFFFQGPAGEELILVGTSRGLFIGYRGRPLQHVLHISDISSAQILQQEKWIVVLAGPTLLAYSLEALVPSPSALKAQRTNGTDSKAPQRLSGSKEVTFFKCGKINSTTLVIFSKKTSSIGKESIFNALEVGPDSKAAKGRFLGFGAKQHESFRTYKEFFIPSSSYSISFLRSKLAIICARGVEIMDVDSLRTMSLPDFKGSHKDDPLLINLEKRCSESKTLGIFRIEENFFLVCFTDFAFAVDKHGEPLLDRHIIDWESRPDSVAHQNGLVLAFSSNLIEIRDASNGRLRQAISGKEIRMTCDGSVVDHERNLQVSMNVNGFHTIFELVSM